jgi:hypothetical protein
MNTPLEALLLEESFYPALYNIQIVGELTCDAAWSKHFQELGGVGVLLQKYLTLSTNFTTTPLEKTCCLRVTGLLNHFSQV